MFKIVICDDQKEILQSTKDFINRSLAGKDIAIDCYDSADALLSGDTSDTDLFILDIAMPDTDGFELAERLNKSDSKARVIFLTSEVGRVFDGYKYRAFRFVAKGDEAALEEGLTAAFDTKPENRCITLNIKARSSAKTQLTFALPHIIYFEYNLRQLSVVTLKGSFEVTGSKLSDLTDKLTDQGFVCVHRSYLVNMAHINCFEKNDIVLSNGEHIYIGSRPYMVRQVKQRYFRYIEED